MQSGRDTFIKKLCLKITYISKTHNEMILDNMESTLRSYMSLIKAVNAFVIR